MDTGGLMNCNRRDPLRYNPAMRVLLVKLSSLGDVIHNLPVVSDLARARPDARIDWAIEAPYAEIAVMHPAVGDALPVPLRRLKSHWQSMAAWRDFLRQRAAISARCYDHIVDTQGLIKSARISGWAEGRVAGFSASSAREPLAARFYDDRIDVPCGLHAVERNRILASRALGYELADAVDYGISSPKKSLPWLPAEQYVVFLHATSRDNKRWPDGHWTALGIRLRDAGLGVILPWGSPSEERTSRRLAQTIPGALVPPAMSLTDAAAMLGTATAVVGVDTGLAHLSVALGRPTVGLYVTTQPGLTGLYGGKAAVNIGGGSEDHPSIADVDTVWRTLRMWLKLA